MQLRKGCRRLAPAALAVAVGLFARGLAALLALGLAFTAGLTFAARLGVGARAVMAGAVTARGVSARAAIVAAFSLLKQGDHLLIATDIYGGTFRVGEKILPNQGVDVSFFDASCPDSLLEAARPNTKMVIFESPTNPNLRVMDIAAIAERAKRLGLLTIFDNTFASPALQNPLALGIDIVVHSTTKYISGHSDIIGGAVVTNDDAIAYAIFEWNKAVGSVPSPFDCWLTLRGVKTLGVRMRQHCANAQKVAEFLANHPKVDHVYFPGLPTHPDHALAKKQLRGGFGGMVSFEIKGGYAEVKAFCEGTKIFILAESLGGIESLIAYPAKMSHATMTEEQRLEVGILPTSIRLSVGIEDADDLIEDLEQALEKA
ncbi:MAG: aminotransferase class I/II-fold pyridoxal phosphate-dependent enzyme [Sphingomonadales bacterium]|nr:aminotransferase class I/II-fold pyridoxal phosphate-dependent enzyme [Sphingomonadales bacterium]